MELSTGVTLAVLAAATFHAVWNAMLKGGRDVLLDAALVAAGGALVMLPLLALVPVPARAAWPYLAASALLHVGYFTTLALSYRFGDLSSVYPIMRGTAPLITTIAAVALLGELPRTSTVIGIVLVCAGVLSLAAIGGRARSRTAIVWALANAAIIAAYTLVDGAGVRVAGDALAYVVWMFFLDTLPFTLIVAMMRGGDLARHLGRHWSRGLASGLFSAASYGIAVWAMSRAPVAAVAALRETSVVIGALIGVWIFKEGHARTRLIGACVVLAGIVALRA
jgi:drug/metabolite transporter (DMT)-like permease